MRTEYFDYYGIVDDVIMYIYESGNSFLLIFFTTFIDELYAYTHGT